MKTLYTAIVLAAISVSAQATPIADGVIGGIVTFDGDDITITGDNIDLSKANINTTGKISIISTGSISSGMLPTSGMISQGNATIVSQISAPSSVSYGDFNINTGGSIMINQPNDAVFISQINSPSTVKFNDFNTTTVDTIKFTQSSNSVAINRVVSGTAFPISGMLTSMSPIKKVNAGVTMTVSSIISTPQRLAPIPPAPVLRLQPVKLPVPSLPTKLVQKLPPAPPLPVLRRR